MSSSNSIALHMLPIQTRPGYSASIALDKLSQTLKRAEKILTPKFYKRIFKGQNKDRARAVVASCLEEVKSIRIILDETKKSANNSSFNPATVGSLERVIRSLDEWCDAGLEFEEAIFGSGQTLLDLTKRLLSLCNDLKSPAAGLH